MTSEVAAIEISHAQICYGSQVAVQNADLSVAPGELHVLLGRSGSGKTTLLRAIAGFETLTQGSLRLHGQLVDEGEGRSMAPEKRNVGVVFQDYALFPHLNVRDNLRFGASKLSDKEVETQLARVGLEGYGARATSALSGGEQQRVALARALAAKPRILLLDEPFSNLDRQLRHDLRERTIEVLREARVAAVFVTHDALEAFALGDRLSVMHEGHLLQSGTAHELYNAPTTRAVAQSVGDAMFIPAEALGEAARCVLGTIPLRQKTMEGEVLMLRPEQICPRGEDDPLKTPGALKLGRARVLRRIYQGAQVRIELVMGDLRLFALVPTEDVSQKNNVTIWLTSPCIML